MRPMGNCCDAGSNDKKDRHGKGKKLPHRLQVDHEPAIVLRKGLYSPVPSQCNSLHHHDSYYTACLSCGGGPSRQRPQTPTPRQPPPPGPQRKYVKMWMTRKRFPPQGTRISEAGPPLSEHYWVKDGRRYAVTEATRPSKLPASERSRMGIMHRLPPYRRGPGKKDDVADPRPKTEVGIRLKDEADVVGADDRCKSNLGPFSIDHIRQDAPAAFRVVPQLSPFPEPPQVVIVAGRASRPMRPSEYDSSASSEEKQVEGAESGRGST